jgi:hypothetical protein
MDQELEKRVSEVERRLNRIDIERAAESVDRKHMDKRFDSLESNLKEIKTTARNLAFTVFSAVIVQVVIFAMNGGFSSIGVK